MIGFLSAHLWVLALALFLAGGAVAVLMRMRSMLAVTLSSLMCMSVFSEYGMFNIFYGEFIEKKRAEFATLSDADKAALTELLDHYAFWAAAKQLLRAHLNSARGLLRTQDLSLLAGLALGVVAIACSIFASAQATNWMMIGSTGSYLVSVLTGMLGTDKIVGGTINVSDGANRNLMANLAPHGTIKASDLLEAALKNISTTYDKAAAMQEADKQATGAAAAAAAAAALETPADPAAAQAAESPSAAPPQDIDGENSPNG